MLYIYMCISERIAGTLQVQARAVTTLASGRDAVVAAETGSGKTLAYLIPVISQLLASRAASLDAQTGEPDQRCALPSAIGFATLVKEYQGRLTGQGSLNCSFESEYCFSLDSMKCVPAELKKP